MLHQDGEQIELKVEGESKIGDRQVLSAFTSFHLACYQSLAPMLISINPISDRALTEVRSVMLWNIANFLETTGLTDVLISSVIPQWRTAKRSIPDRKAQERN